MSWSEKLFEWQLWAHYIILTVAVIILQPVLNNWSILGYGDTRNFLSFFILIVVIDQLLHFLLGYLTGWED